MRFVAVLLVLLIAPVEAQESTYQNSISAEPPYYRVRYEASSNTGELIFPASFTVWIPPDVESLRGLVVHQHGCGEGSCKSGLTGAFDLHWQALARKHHCALIAPVFEQPEKADCQMWCDPRNGSDTAFQKALMDLGRMSGHPEFSQIPWAMWGHSGGGHWVGGMLLLHPERVAAAWLRSGVPSVQAREGGPRHYDIPAAACRVPVMCNLGTKEGVTDKESRFAGVWPAVEFFSRSLRSRGALLAVSIDPLSSHDCGNQRYLAIPWLDECLTLRLPETSGQELKSLSLQDGWIATLAPGDTVIQAPVPGAQFQGELETSIWLPGEAMAKAWAQYTKDSAVRDSSPPPAPSELNVHGNELQWTATADLESGLAGFIIERDGQHLAKVPEQSTNPFGRPLFQNLSYSDTPTQPLQEMRFADVSAVPGTTHRYRIIAVNTVGLKSQATEQSPAAAN